MGRGGTTLDAGLGLETRTDRLGVGATRAPFLARNSNAFNSPSIRRPLASEENLPPSL